MKLTGCSVRLSRAMSDLFDPFDRDDFVLWRRLGLKCDAAHRMIGPGVAIRQKNPAFGVPSWLCGWVRCVICPMRRIARHNAPAHKAMTGHQIEPNRSDIALGFLPVTRVFTCFHLY